MIRRRNVFACRSGGSRDRHPNARCHWRRFPRLRRGVRWLSCSCRVRSHARNAGIRPPRKCRPRPASSFTTARAVACSCDPNLAIVVCSVPTGRGRARRSSRTNPAVGRISVLRRGDRVRYCAARHTAKGLRVLHNMHYAKLMGLARFRAIAQTLEPRTWTARPAGLLTSPARTPARWPLGRLATGWPGAGIPRRRSAVSGAPARDSVA